MAFSSILHPGDAAAIESHKPPAYFHDLNLDAIVAAVTAGKEEYDLAPFFSALPDSLETIRYRQDVASDLEVPAMLECVRTFAAAMHEGRERGARAGALQYEYQRKRCFLDATLAYCGAVRRLAAELPALAPASAGLRAFADYAAAYASSNGFESLETAARALETSLAELRYDVLLTTGGLTVRHYREEADYSAEIARAFDKFRRNPAKDYRVTFRPQMEMNHIEAQILEYVVRLFPNVFERLDDFCAANRAYEDAILRRFDREIQFYVAYLEYLAPLRAAGLGFCRPEICVDKEIYAEQTFDLALAAALVSAGRDVVRNDIELRAGERIAIITGPNQGGKSTLARTFGQLHHLANLGCAVPGLRAKLFAFDALFTHFEKEEAVENLRGKLSDDLVRVREILRTATTRSIVILNEIFNSTAPADATFLARKVLDAIAALDAICVCVTFLGELAADGRAATVSIVATVDAIDPAIRTFRLVRRPPDGRSYALSLAEKRGLTYERLRERLSGAAGPPAAGSEP